MTIISSSILEVSAYLQYDITQAQRDEIANKIFHENDTTISKALRYVGIKNYTSMKASQLTYLFIEKEMWHSCRYMITHTRYNFNHIIKSNDDVRRFYLLMSMIIEIYKTPPLYALFLINNAYLCGELLELYLSKYSIECILYQCKWFRYMPYYNSLIPIITEYLKGVKFISSMRGEWIKACIII